jgi:transcriptional regulator with XRE-family HTH domain
MKKSQEAGERIRALRLARRETQAEFAVVLGVTQPMISAWEAGRDDPSAEAWLKLANLAGFSDALFFWGQAGVDQHVMLSAAEDLLRERGVQEVPGEIVRIERSSTGLPEAEGPGPLLPVAAQFVSDPLSTRWLVVDDKLANSIFPAGDLILLDESAKDAKDLLRLWGEIVLVHLTRPEDLGGLRMAGFWKEGLNIGRLLCRTTQSGDRLYWAATLGPFDDADKWYAVDGRTVFLGAWRHPGPPKEPVEGSARSKAEERLRKARARRQEIYSELAARGGAAIHLTLEFTKAEKQEAEAANLLRRLERAEMDEAKLEARAKAPSSIALFKGCRILGRVTGWFRAPEQKRTEKEKGNEFP